VFSRGSIAGWTPITVVVVAAAAGLLLASGSATADNTISSKRAQAEAIMAQVQQLGVEVDQASNAYAAANTQLTKIDTDLVSNKRNLVAARKSLGVAQQAIASRLRDLYINGNGDSTLEVLLGSQSLDDIITRLDAINRVSNQDAKVLNAVKKYRSEVETRRANLQDARVAQAQVVAERAAQKRSIESQIAEQQQLLASVKDEIVKLQQEEQQRQAELAAQARARLQAQQAAAAAAQQAASQSVTPDYVPDPVYEPNLPPAHYTGAVAIALQYLGVPYVWGGASPATGFDCSGFVMYVYAQLGVSLPHNAAAQYGYGTPVPRDQLQPGDLVFFDGLGHVGLYIGNGQFVHAPHTGDVVKISSLSDSWYAATYVGARRI
jgi:cell wall-associated NlpC family hydrolase